MKPPAAFDKVNCGVSALLAVVFLIGLCLPTVDSLFDVDKAPWVNENRAPAKFPQVTLSVQSLRALPAGLEAYYHDHFGFRKRLIRWDKKWKYELFKEETYPDVMKGRDGWLFYTAQQMVEHFRGIKTFTPEELRNWQSLLEKRRDWLASRGIKYVFVIPPDKHSIYPEYLPDWLTKVGPTKLDKLIAYMKEHSTVEVLDLRPVLMAAKKTARTYLYSDTHWNSYGSFIAYQALMRALALQLPGLGAPLPYEAFQPTVFQEKGGDLARILGQKMPDRVGVVLYPRPPLQLPEPEEDINIFVKKWNKDTLPVYTENPARRYTLLCFHDSFAMSLTQLLGYHFKRTVYIWQYNWNKQLIERQKPDVVVDEILERFVNDMDVRKLMKDDGLS
jgi:hypothetical protein